MTGRRYVLGLDEIDKTQVALVGGKGANLGELSRIEGIRVPAGYCVTTDAFLRIMSEAPSIDDRLDRLSRLKPGDRETIRTLSAEIRRTLEGVAIPDDLAAAITRSLAGLGEQTACAVRSSATAEDLPTASFAGQQDTYLNVVGTAAILRQVRRCWASLFTERAVTYRLHNGIDHRKVRMAVVVQQMVFSQAAGILFTADPVTSNRKVTSVEAGFGLGEALVSRTKEREVLERLRALPEGERKADEAKGMIDRVRTFSGYREYPKYGMVSRYFVYKQALLEEAEHLVQAHVLHEKEDIFFLRFQELHDVVRTHRVDDRLIRERKDAFRSYRALTPPRVLTSDGEVIAGAYRRDDLRDPVRIRDCQRTRTLLAELHGQPRDGAGGGDGLRRGCLLFLADDARCDLGACTEGRRAGTGAHGRYWHGDCWSGHVAHDGKDHGPTYGPACRRRPCPHYRASARHSRNCRRVPRGEPATTSRLPPRLQMR